MTINIRVPDMTELKPRITVFGVGGAGGNAVNNMIACGLRGVEFVVANTDAQALTSTSAERRTHLGDAQGDRAVHTVEHVLAAVVALRIDDLTIDIDGLDPSLVPTTGTPEPGGLGWYETLALIQAIARKRRIIGMDLVEFSRTDNSDAPAFLCSKLVYKCLAYIFSDESPKIPIT